MAKTLYNGHDEDYGNNDNEAGQTDDQDYHINMIMNIIISVLTLNVFVTMMSMILWLK